MMQIPRSYCRLMPLSATTRLPLPKGKRWLACGAPGTAGAAGAQHSVEHCSESQKPLNPDRWLESRQVCLEPLAPDAAVWHCSGGAANPGGGCFCVVHLLCAQAWARSQQADAAARAAALAAAPPDLCATFLNLSYGFGIML